jgi:hypothetical protein
MKTLHTRTLALLVCGMLCAKHSYGQYFSKRINYYNLNTLITNFKFVNDTFYFPLLIDYTGGNLLGKVAVDGTEIYTPLLQSIPGSGNGLYAIVHYNNSIYASGGGGLYKTIQTPFVKFKPNGDTVFTKLISDTTYYTLVQKMLPSSTSNSTLLLIGGTDSTCGSGNITHYGRYKTLIRLVDTNGVLLQNRMYAPNCKYMNVSAVDTTEDKGYIITGSELQTFTGLYFLMKLDSNLNQVWYNYYNLTGIKYSGVVTSKRGGYILGHTITDSIWNKNYTYERPAITRINTDGTIRWHREYGVKDIAQGVVVTRECANGDIIACGIRYNKVSTTLTQYQGFIMRTDSLGNLKWWRNYAPITSPVQDTVSDNYLYDMHELPNGDIAAAGTTGGSNVVTPLQQAWLLKVDSNGCLGAGNCPPNMAPVANAVEELGNASTTVKVFPNPFNEELKINLSAPAGTKNNFRVELLDVITGRVVLQQALTTNSVTLVNTSVLANGLYIVHVKDAATFNYYAKHIKIH